MARRKAGGRAEPGVFHDPGFPRSRPPSAEALGAGNCGHFCEKKAAFRRPNLGEDLVQRRWCEPGVVFGLLLLDCKQLIAQLCWGGRVGNDILASVTTEGVPNFFEDIHRC